MSDVTVSRVARVSRASASRKVPRWMHWRAWLPTTVMFACVAVLWQVVAFSNPYVLPTLGDIGSSLVNDAGMYWSNFLITLQEIVVGAGAGILAGFALAVVMAEFRIVERAVMPLVVIIMVTPIVAIAPALVVAFGFGMIPKYIVTGLVVFFPMLVNSLAGLRNVDQRALDVMKTLHASRLEVFRFLRLPGCMPYVFAGLRIALPMAVVGAAVAEFVAAGQQAGLGSLVTTSAAQANLAVTWGAITLLAQTGVMLVILHAVVRKRVLWWSEDDVTAR
ncbi:ABC transporter permease [Demequina sp. B12]|uniref:ABC transporter permease n=1 Tax=Demequina sp. B12 TaxID=2992757 RepID=UPI00237BC329|nr:ABC transporter permease [Demequina sp. B12]MDE0573683.1 ABC transporter permease [Demequina sp. B12]